jgi:hypothetical protein
VFVTVSTGRYFTTLCQALVINKWVTVACSCEAYKQAPYFQGLFENSLLWDILYINHGSETRSTYVLTRKVVNMKTHLFYEHRLEITNKIEPGTLWILTSRLIFMAQQPLVGHSLLIIEASRSHSDAPHSVGLLWTSDQPDAENYAWQHTLTRDRHLCPPQASNPQFQKASGRRPTP